MTGTQLQSNMLPKKFQWSNTQSKDGCYTTGSNQRLQSETRGVCASPAAMVHLRALTARNSKHSHLVSWSSTSHCLISEKTDSAHKVRGKHTQGSTSGHLFPPQNKSSWPTRQASVTHKYNLEYVMDKANSPFARKEQHGEDNKCL